MTYRKILIAVDSSKYSVAAAKKGLDLAHQLNAKVALIFVVDISKTIGSTDAGILPADALIVLKKEAKELLDGLAETYKGDELEKFTPSGLPTEAIVNTAETWEADLVICGTHGRTGLKHLLLGSIAESVVRHSKVPVMVVPLKETKLD